MLVITSVVTICLVNFIGLVMFMLRHMADCIKEQVITA